MIDAVMLFRTTWLAVTWAQHAAPFKSAKLDDSSLAQIGKPTRLQFASCGMESDG